MSQKIIGTAGHIDHGKTSLVRALTGTDTDRLKEEKERQITIDLGFAFLGDDIAFIDVPGHEKFVKNMVAGVTGIDIAILVIAADDGIMPQTREHLDILKILQVKKIIPVITKIDMVDSEWLELISTEIKSWLVSEGITTGTSSPKLGNDNEDIFFISSISGKGIPELKDHLVKTCGEHTKTVSEKPFMMPVDRAFSMTGFGTVVTGTVHTGILEKGLDLEILPEVREVKLRGIQAGNKKVETAAQGDRAAINLTGISKDEVNRGDIIAEKGYFLPSDNLNCELNYLQSNSKPLKFRDRVRFHSGTTEKIGRVVILEKDIIQPGEKALVQIQLENPTAVSALDKFIIRSYSPSLTIGGGRILEVNAAVPRRNRKQIAEMLSASQEKNFKDVLQNHIRNGGLKLFSTSELAQKFSSYESEINTILSKDKKIIPLNSDSSLHNDDRSTANEERQKKDSDAVYWISKEEFRLLAKLIKDELDDFHTRFPERKFMKIVELKNSLKVSIDETMWKFALKAMHHGKKIEISGKDIKSFEFEAMDSEKTQKIKNEILALINDAGNSAPEINEIVREIDHDEQKLHEIIRNMSVGSEVVLLENKFVYSLETIERIKQTAIDLINEDGYLTISTFRVAIETSRKYALPLLNYLDDTKITIRNGDKRSLM